MFLNKIDMDEEDDNDEDIDTVISNDEIFVERPKESIQMPTSVELSPFNRNVVKCILLECTDQLLILRNINNQNNANFMYTSIEYCNIADRYKGGENHAEHRINSSSNNYEKLARDINRIVQVINECLEDINVNGKFDLLNQAVVVMRYMREDERKLIEEKEKNDKYVVELRKRCEEELLKNNSHLEETDVNIHRLRYEAEDLQVYKNYELNYFENWENARKEQNSMSCEKSEQYYQKIIDDTKKNIYSENRCHLEFENFIEESKNDYLDDIQYWMRHYDEETETRETDMINLKAKMEKLAEDHIALKQKYEAHKAEMEDWLAYKKRKREKAALEALQNWAATKIQAWWRGVMYRKKLGPYRKKKKGKGKGDTKGKKGKKGKKK